MCWFFELQLYSPTNPSSYEAMDQVRVLLRNYSWFLRCYQHARPAGRFHGTSEDPIRSPGWVNKSAKEEPRNSVGEQHPFYLLQCNNPTPKFQQEKSRRRFLIPPTYRLTIFRSISGFPNFNQSWWVGYQPDESYNGHHGRLGLESSKRPSGYRQGAPNWANKDR